MSDLELEPDVDIGLLFISQAIDPLHKLPAEASEAGDRYALAARVGLWDDVIRKAADLREVAAQALGDLMEADAERVDTVGMVTRERPVKTEWKRGDCIDAMKAKVVDDLALNKATGERSDQVRSVAQFAISMFLKLVSPPQPTVGGCKAVDLRLDDFYSRTVDQERWKIKIVAER